MSNFLSQTLAKVSDIKASQLLDGNGNLSYEKLLEYSFRNSSLNQDQSISFSHWKEDFLHNYDLNTLYLDDESNWVMFSSDEEFVTAFQKAEKEAKVSGQPKLIPRFDCYSAKIWKRSPMKLNNCAVTILKCKTNATQKGICRPSKKARKDSKLLKEFEQCVLTIGEGVHTVVEGSIKLQKKLKKSRKNKKNKKNSSLTVTKNSSIPPGQKNLLLLKDNFHQIVILTFQENISLPKILEMITELGSSLEKCVLVVGEGVHRVVEGSRGLTQNVNVKETKRVLQSVVSAASSVFSETKKTGACQPKKYNQVTYSRAIADSKINASEFATSVTTLRRQSKNKKAKVSPLFSDLLMSENPDSDSEKNQAGTSIGHLSDQDFDKYLSWYRLATAVHTKNCTQVKDVPNKTDLDHANITNEMQSQQRSDSNSALCAPQRKEESENTTPHETQKVESSQITNSPRMGQSCKTSNKHDNGILSDSAFDKFLTWWSPSEKRIHRGTINEEKTKDDALNRKRSLNDLQDEESQKNREIDQFKTTDSPAKSSDEKEKRRDVVANFRDWWSRFENQIDFTSKSDNNVEFFMQFWEPEVKPKLDVKSERSLSGGNNEEDFSQNSDEECLVFEHKEGVEAESIVEEAPDRVELQILDESLNRPDTEEDVSVTDLETISDVSADAETKEVDVINDIEIVFSDGMVIVEEGSAISTPKEVTDDEWSVDFNFEVESVETVLSEEMLVSSVKSKESDHLVLVPSKSIEVVSIKSSVSSEEDDDDFSLISENDIMNDDNLTLVSEANSTFSMPSVV